MMRFNTLRKLRTTEELMQHGITQREPKSEPCTPIGARVQQSQGWYNNVSVTPVKHAEVAAQGKDRSGLARQRSS